MKTSSNLQVCLAGSLLLLALFFHLLHAPGSLVGLVLSAAFFVAEILTVELCAARQIPALIWVLVGQDFTRAFHLFFNLLNSKRFLMKLAFQALGFLGVLAQVKVADLNNPVSGFLAEKDVLLVNFHVNKNKETSYAVME